MQLIRRFVLLVVFLGFFGLLGSYKFHFFWFQQKIHMVAKDKMSFENIYFNLDKAQSKWTVVWGSHNLKAYLWNRYQDKLSTYLSGSTKEMWETIKAKGGSFLESSKVRLKTEYLPYVKKKMKDFQKEQSNR